jgi:hypothetical protein
MWAAQMLAIFSSPRRFEHKQRAIEVFGGFAIRMADDAPHPVMAERDDLVGHDPESEGEGRLMVWLR